MIGHVLPTITCTTVTKGRHKLIKKAITCYTKQKYPCKNMVIVSQGNVHDNELIQSYLGLLNRPDIKFYVAPPSINLGTLRNISVELANGEIVCQWDDDDLSHPDRLTYQYKSLVADSSNVVSAYSQFLKYYKTSDELYWCDWSGERKENRRYHSGTMMFYKLMFGMFNTFYPQTGDQCHVEEDWNALQKLQTKGGLADVPYGWHYAYVYHGDNVYNLQHHNLSLNTQSGKRIVEIDELVKNRELLEDSFRMMEIDDRVNVRSSKGIAFVYQP